MGILGRCVLARCVLGRCLLWACSLLIPLSAHAQATDVDAPEAAPSQAPSVSADSAPADSAPADSASADPDRAELLARLEELSARVESLSERVRRAEARDAEPSLGDLDEEVSATLASLEEAEDELDVPVALPLRLYGFMDMGYHKFFISNDSIVRPFLPADANSFVFGNLNIFLDAAPSDDWRALMELRFTTLPHGEELSFATPLGDSYERVDNTTLDVTSANGRGEVVTANVIIERAWLEWSPADWLRLRLGSWFTPVGIWNLDHGTPTLISLLLPDTQVTQAFPLRQLGLQAFGSVPVGNAEIGYHAYLSNGRTPGQFDLTEDKMVGGRLLLRTGRPAWGTTVGVSGYWGAFADIQKTIVRFDPFEVEVTRTISAREWGLGGDVAVNAGAFRFRSEFILHRIEYETGRRAPAGFGRPGTFVPDHYSLDVYALAAYRAPHGIEPYLWLEALHRPNLTGDTQLIPSVGVNLHLHTQVQLKVQYGAALFFDVTLDLPGNPRDTNFHILTSRLVVAF